MTGRFWRCALLTLVALAGCGDDDSASPSTAQNGSTSSTTTSISTSVPASVEGSTLLIPDDVFGLVPDGTGSHEAIIVEADADDGVVVEALRRAAARVMLVTDDGTEHPDDASVERSGLYSPNYVADPQIKPDGVRMYVDCKGVIAPTMAVTFRQILREELLRAGITDATVRPDLG